MNDYVEHLLSTVHIPTGLKGAYCSTESFFIPITDLLYILYPTCCVASAMGLVLLLDDVDAIELLKLGLLDATTD